MMNIKERISALAEVGNILSREALPDYAEKAIIQAHLHNRWFTKENIKKSIAAICQRFLNQEYIDQWLSEYALTEPENPRKVGLVLAGNIPFVGVHDVISVFVTGHLSHIKYSEKDEYLIPMLIETLISVDTRTSQYFEKVERLNDVEAVIATGSNNSSRYFEYYFGKLPNIIRKNRSAVAVISEDTDMDDLKMLGHDVFSYFGLGCRNVSKIYLPQGYAIEKVMEAFENWKEIVLHNKYKNNFDYNYSIYLLNKVKFFTNGCIIAKQSEDIPSRISVLNFDYYESPSSLTQELHDREEEIQCVIAKHPLENLRIIPFGKSQEPNLWDYADGVDTIKFLMELS